ncbi:MAG: DUF6196 family protein [Actinoplanes sp.]
MRAERGSRPPPDLLTVVRDNDRWSWLAPAGTAGGERFALFSFHFPMAMCS